MGRSRGWGAEIAKVIHYFFKLQIQLTPVKWLCFPKRGRNVGVKLVITQPALNHVNVLFYKANLVVKVYKSHIVKFASCQNKDIFSYFF